MRFGWAGRGRRDTPRLLLFRLLLLLHLAKDSRQSTAKKKAHEYMTSAELGRTFQVDHPDDVPDYEIVNIHHRRHRRSADADQIHQIGLDAFGQRFELELNRNLNLVPSQRRLNVFYADKDREDIVYATNKEDDDDELGDLWQDEQNMAALLLYKQSGRNQYSLDGTIGEELVVKPAPESVTKFASQFSRLPDWDNWGANTLANSSRRRDDIDIEDEEELPVDYAFLDEDELSDYNAIGSELRSMRRRRRSSELGREPCLETGAHIVFRRRRPESETHHSDYGAMETDKLPYGPGRSHSRHKRQAPYMIFPEILVIVDYDGYRLHGEDNIAIKRYVISFWNGVDLRYKLLQGPSVKISIAGIIISRGRDATPYLERNRVGRDAIDAASALTDMGKYLFLERRLPVYDIAVAITKLDMCRRKTQRGDCNRGTAGFAYVGGACVVNKRLEKVNSVAIVEDTGGFSGIIVAAHELGHLLGAVHDGSPPPSYLGGPGAVKCSWEDGFIMSDLRHTSKGFKWSLCTVRQFQHFLNGETATCMYNSPHEEESLPRVLPGKLLSLDAQCRKDRGTSACFKDDRVCAQLFCFDAGSGYCVSYRPAAEGSRCGDNQMCLNGRCVSDHENAIDYGDGSFLRRTGTAVSNSFGKESSSTTARTWWNQITTPSPTTTTTKPTTTYKPRAKTTMPWWKRLQQKTLSQRQEKDKKGEKSTSRPTKKLFLTTSSRTTSTTPLPPPTPPPPTTTTTTEVSVFKDKDLDTVSKQKQSDLVHLNTLGSSEQCEDRITNIAGSMSCKAFLRSFAYQYCRHKYIQKNCCQSHKRFCSGATHGRR